jgi:hypothetical protein
MNPTNASDSLGPQPVRSSLQESQPFDSNDQEPSNFDPTSAEYIPLPESDKTAGRGNETNHRRMPTHDGGAADSSSPSQLPPPPLVENEFLRKSGFLAKWLQHIEPVVIKTCRDPHAGVIQCFDYFDGEENPQVPHPPIAQDFGPGDNQLFKRLTCIEDDRVTKRLLLVQDLTPFLIASLGDSFDIDPEYFAEHLNRSGYHNHSYEEDLPRVWATRNFKKPWASLKWYRPVLQDYTIAKRLNDSSILKTAKERSLEPWEEVRYSVKSQGSKKKLVETRINHKWKIGSNIFRQGWLLSTRTDSSREDRVSVAWEE